MREREDQLRVTNHWNMTPDTVSGMAEMDVLMKEKEKFSEEYVQAYATLYEELEDEAALEKQQQGEDLNEKVQED